MKVRLRRVGVGSVFLLALVVYAAAGLVVGGLVAAATSLPLPEGYELTFLDRLGPWALAVFPALYGVVGGFLAALAAVLYNVAAAVTGGIRVDIPDLERVEESEPRPQTRSDPEPEAASGTSTPGQPDAAGAAGASAPEAGEEPSSRRSSGE